jgi:hypothetical protein
VGAYLFIFFHGLWLAAIGAACMAARARLRREEYTGRAALLLAMTRGPCTIQVGSDKNRVRVDA